MLTSKLSLMINFIVFQLGWAITVYYHNAWAGVIGISLALINYILLPGSFLRNCGLALSIAALGISNDLIFEKLGFLKFTNTMLFPIPLWLIAVWLLFVSTFTSSMAWLSRVNWIFLVVLGGVGGSLSYCAGANLGALSYHNDAMPEFVFHALNWGVLFPVLFLMRKRCDRSC